ncbi:MAG TPA: hypothetical protein PKC21_02395 [Oligoflexia bacterium]|nr:hypothetical protein [Oligoflexia bacterium]HMR24181.1 hypothetical protein [Oligoflexia bacterium]
MNSKQTSPTSHDYFLNQLQSNDIFAKTQKKDASIWSNDKKVQQSIKNRLGWTQSNQFISQFKEKINDFYEKIQHSGYRDFVWIGMGGSSLFAKTLAHVFQAKHFYIIDSTDTEHINACLSKLDLSKTLFFIASKSGTTLETLSVFHYLQQLNIPDHHFVSVSDENTTLSQHFTLDDHNYYDQFINPSDIGGRFSSTSYFGLLPLALIDFNAFHDNVNCFLESSNSQDLQKGIESFAAKVFYLYKNHGSNKLILHFPDQLSYFTHWVEQLVAESTGKNNRGFIPLPSEYIDNDREDYIHIYNAQSQNITKIFAQTLSFPINADKNNLLLQSYAWMHITAILGYFLQLNPFDEPNVALAKSFAQDYLKQENLTPADVLTTLDDSFFEHLNKQSKKNNFIAVLFFGHDDTEHLKKLCKHLSKTYQQPCIPYYGPQYLHSVGQYFKGGHHDVSFIIAYCENDDLSEEQKHLEKIKLAQCLGDYHALQQLKKPVIFVKQDELFKLS